MKQLIRATATVLMISGAAFAQAGLGPVLQELERQGYTNIETMRETNRIRILAQRGDDLRELVYDANTGALLSDDAILLRDRDRLRDQDMDGDGVPDRDQDRDQDRDRVDAPSAGTSGAGGGGGQGRGN